MPRQGRIHIAGGIYHVIARGIERKTIFKDVKDRREFLRRLSLGLSKTKNRCYAWALLDNHFHLLLTPEKIPISQLLHSVITGYALYFNHRHKRVGHLFQNRYKSILCQKENYFIELIRYIHLNPLKAKLVESIAELGQYPWTGHATLLGNRTNDWQATEEVLMHFGKEKARAISGYVQFMQDGIGNTCGKDLEGGGLVRSAGGWAGIRDLKKARDYWQRDERILGDGVFVAEVMKEDEVKMNNPEKLRRKGWTLEKIAFKICEIFGVEEAVVHKKWRVNQAKKARALVAYLGKNELGMPVKVLAEYLAVQPSGIIYLIKKGEAIKAEVDVNWLF